MSKLTNITTSPKHLLQYPQTSNVIINHHHSQTRRKLLHPAGGGSITGTRRGAQA